MVSLCSASRTAKSESLPLSSADGAAMECRVLSIQSHVVRGYVGNKSASFPLQVNASLSLVRASLSSRAAPGEGLSCAFECLSCSRAHRPKTQRRRKCLTCDHQQEVKCSQVIFVLSSHSMPRSLFEPRSAMCITWEPLVTRGLLCITGSH